MVTISGRTNGKQRETRREVVRAREERSPVEQRRAPGAAALRRLSLRREAPDLYLPGASKPRMLAERVQIWLWERLFYRIAATANVPQEQTPPVEHDWVQPIPAGRRYPGLGEVKLIFSE